jgi:L-alanine-DL-glutamate epimerase-like enolase superfamily enzyme
MELDRQLEGGPNVRLRLYRLPLALRVPFGTAHSSTAARVNCALSATAAVDPMDAAAAGCSVVGWAECGLPPVKAGVYHADAATTCDAVAAIVAAAGAAAGLERPSPRNAAATVEALLAAVRAVPERGPSDRPARCLVTGALCDLLARLRVQPLHTMLGLPHPGPCRSYATVAMPEGISAAEAAAADGADGTDAAVAAALGADGSLSVAAFDAALADAVATGASVKLKVGRCLGYMRWALERAAAALERAHPGSAWSLCVDANAAWTPEIGVAFVDTVLPEIGSAVAARIYMVEQPFPVAIGGGGVGSGDDKAAWIDFRERCNRAGIRVYADESMATAADIDPLRPLCDGVNIKLEKCGGLDAAIDAARAAQRAGMSVWFGCMVSSRLATTASAHLLALATHGADLDGGHLVTEASQPFAGGLQWFGSGSEAADPCSNVNLECCVSAVGGTNRRIDGNGIRVKDGHDDDDDDAHISTSLQPCCEKLRQN